MGGHKCLPDCQVSLDFMINILSHFDVCERSPEEQNYIYGNHE